MDGKIYKYMTIKNNILLGSVLSSIILLAIFIISRAQSCYSNEFCTNLYINFHPFVLVDFLFIAPAVLFLSLVTYFLRGEIFWSWISFAKWWVPLTIVLTILTPETTGSAFVPFFARSEVAIGMSALFLVISLVIIIWKSWTLHSKKA